MAALQSGRTAIFNKKNWVLWQETSSRKGDMPNEKDENYGRSE